MVSSDLISPSDFISTTTKQTNKQTIQILLQTCCILWKKKKIAKLQKPMAARSPAIAPWSTMFFFSSSSLAREKCVLKINHEGYKINKPFLACMSKDNALALGKRLSPKFPSCPRTILFLDNLSPSGIKILPDIPATGRSGHISHEQRSQVEQMRENASFSVKDPEGVGSAP